MNKTIVLGIGNPILRDDGVGIRVVEKLKSQFHDEHVTMDVAYTGGMNLLDLVRGFDKVILVDAIIMERARTGEVKRLLLPEAPAVHSSNPHDISFSEALLLARKLGEHRLPKEVIVIGIVVKETRQFGEQLSNEVSSAIPGAISLILTELSNT